MNPIATTRVDLHCHSTASEVSKLGIQRSLGLPECATPPEEVYELAKRRGMDFVTITDHDTIDGCLELAGRDDIFISEELTAWFWGEPQAVHLLCLGITPDDHARLHERNRDLESCAEYLYSHEIACSLAHPFYAVEAPLTPAHRRQLAQLFPVWETRNGSRARELNMPAAIYIETHGGTGTGGSDDHAGVDIGRTFTETPPAARRKSFCVTSARADAEARGEQGSAAKWAHSAMALGTRALLMKDGTRQRTAPSEPDRDAILKIAERVMSRRRQAPRGDRRRPRPRGRPRAAHAFVPAVGVEPGRALIDHMQAEDFSHDELARRARRTHERRLRGSWSGPLRTWEAGDSRAISPSGRWKRAATSFEQRSRRSRMRRRRRSSARRRPSSLRARATKRVALVADGIEAVHGVTHTLERIRELGVPGYEVHVIGTDRNVDRRLPAVTEVEMPSTAGLRIGVPSLPAMVNALGEGHYDAVHLPRPAGWHPRGPDRPDHGPAGPRQRPDRVRRRTPTCVPARPEVERARGPRDRRVLPAGATTCSPRARPATSRLRANGYSSHGDRPLGTRGGHLSLWPRIARGMAPDSVFAPAT